MEVEVEVGGVGGEEGRHFVWGGERERLGEGGEGERRSAVKAK